MISTFLSCDKESEYSTNTHELSQIITLESKPISVKYAIVEVDNGFMGPNDYNLISVLTYDDETFRIVKSRVISTSNSLEPKYLNKTAMQNWLPDTIKMNFVKKNSKYLSLKNKSFDAKIFARSPYMSGFCFFTDDNEVYLYLHTD